MEMKSDVGEMNVGINSDLQMDPVNPAITIAGLIKMKGKKNPLVAQQLATSGSIQQKGLLQFSQFFLNHLGRQRDVTVFHHNLLTNLGQNHFHEFCFQRRHRLVGVLVHVNVQVT